MKKTNNKGFSLVELIIVIAIMAILAGAIAPALIRYIDKSRKSNDVSSCKTIKTAVETAMGNEDTYELLTNAGSGSSFSVVPSQLTSNPAAAVTNFPTSTIANVSASAQKEIAENIGEKTPKIKYKKNNPSNFFVQVTAGGSVKVGIVAGGNQVEVVPELTGDYK